MPLLHLLHCLQVVVGSDFISCDSPFDLRGPTNTPIANLVTVDEPEDDEEDIETSHDQGQDMTLHGEKCQKPGLKFRTFTRYSSMTNQFPFGVITNQSRVSVAPSYTTMTSSNTDLSECSGTFVARVNLMDRKQKQSVPKHVVPSNSNNGDQAELANKGETNNQKKLGGVESICGVPPVIHIHSVPSVPPAELDDLPAAQEDPSPGHQPSSEEFSCQDHEESQENQDVSGCDGTPPNTSSSEGQQSACETAPSEDCSGSDSGKLNGGRSSCCLECGCRFVFPNKPVIPPIKAASSPSHVQDETSLTLVNTTTCKLIAVSQTGVHRFIRLISLQFL
jgi:hypothetical protein